MKLFTNTGFSGDVYDVPAVREMTVSCENSRGAVTRTQKLRSLLLETELAKVLTVETGVGQNIALHASRPARNST